MSYFHKIYHNIALKATFQHNKNHLEHFFCNALFLQRGGILERRNFFKTSKSGQ